MTAHATQRRLRVAVALAAVAALMGAAPLSAQAATSAGSFETEGNVFIQTASNDQSALKPGTQYVEINISLPAGSKTDSFIGTWDRADGSWLDANDASQFLVSAQYTDWQDCRTRSAKSFLRDNDVYDEDDFYKRWGVPSANVTKTPDADAYDQRPIVQRGWSFSPEEISTIQQPCGQPGWVNPSVVKQMNDDGTELKVLVPTTVLGEGEHKLFLLPIFDGTMQRPDRPVNACDFSGFQRGWLWFDRCRVAGVGTPITADITIAQQPEQTPTPTPTPSAPAERGGPSGSVVVVIVAFAVVLLAGGAVLALAYFRSRAAEAARDEEDDDENDERDGDAVALGAVSEAPETPAYPATARPNVADAPAFAWPGVAAPEPATEQERSAEAVEATSASESSLHEPDLDISQADVERLDLSMDEPGETEEPDSPSQA